MKSDFVTKTISKSLFVLVGMTRLHGTNNDDNMPRHRVTFFLLNILLVVMCMGLVGFVPIPDSLTSIFFFVIQIMDICKTYEDHDRNTLHIVATILKLTVISLVIYFLGRKLDDGYRKLRRFDTDSLMLADKIRVDE